MGPGEGYCREQDAGHELFHFEVSYDYGGRYSQEHGYQGRRRVS